LLDIELTPKQQQVLAAVIDWYKSNKQGFLTIGGYAGTGKTTITAYLRNLLDKENPKLKVAFCSFTGKATRVLDSKLRDAKATRRQDNVSTIHSLIYAPMRDRDNEIIGWERKSTEDFGYDLIIVDEASMVNSDIWEDLTSYGIPILAVGDHGQLPPIGGSFNLMENPQLRLEEIFRQEEGNPIIRLSMLARNEGEIPFGVFGRGVKKLHREDPDTQEFLGDKLIRAGDELLVLTGYNHTRVKLNSAIRGLLEFESPQPMGGDRVICLRNNHKHMIYNGMMGEVKSIQLKEDKSGKFYSAEILFDGEKETFKGDLSVEQFGQQTTLKDERRKGIELFDFGYALTVHKSQGSQAHTVVVFEERFAQMDNDTWRRWLYTAVTRARKELFIIA
jgi:exodeoxyribonuclease-5